MIVDKVLSAHDLIEEIETLMHNPDSLHRMAEAAKSLGKPNAAKDIADLALEIAK